MKYIEEFYLFVKVVQEGGFSHAAAALGMPTGTISRRISQLEEQLGCALLHRSTRKLRLTDEGLRYYERLCTPLAEIEQATGEIQGQETDISGLIRLAAPIALSNTILVDMLADFGLRYPGVQFDISQTNDHAPLCDRTGIWCFSTASSPRPCPMPSASATSSTACLPPLFIWRRWASPPIRRNWKSTISSIAGPTSTGS